MLQMLLSNGVDVNVKNATDMTPILVALSAKNYDVVEALLDSASTLTNIN